MVKPRSTTRSTGARERTAPGTQVIARAAAVLKAFGGARAEWGLSDLAAELGLHKTTVFRILGALESEGFVERDLARQTYRLGSVLIGLGTRAGRATGLHAAAHRVLEALAAETGETTTLEILVGDEVLILDEVHGRYLVGATPEIGMRWPAHVTSTGKVLLAAARFATDTDDASTTRAPVARPRLARLGPNSITSQAALTRELTAVWARGYAVANEEVERGFVAVGAPVRDLRGRVVAAISVGGPRDRIPRARLTSLAAAVRAAADGISARLGAPVAPPGHPPASARDAPASAQPVPARGRAPRARSR